MQKKKYYIGDIKDFSDYNGWFMGHFIDGSKYPLLKSDKIEIAWKELPEDFREDDHTHKKAIEVNIVISGWIEVNINKKRFKVTNSQFYVIYPLTNLAVNKVGKRTKVIVVKFPSIKDDKFLFL